jgi:hypothetical protein
MGISKYALYKYVEVEGTWLYCEADDNHNGKIKPDIIFVNEKERLLEKRPEGRYYLSRNGGWIDAGNDARTDLVVRRTNDSSAANSDWRERLESQRRISAAAVSDRPLTFWCCYGFRPSLARTARYALPLLGWPCHRSKIAPDPARRNARTRLVALRAWARSLIADPIGPMPVIRCR